MSFGPASPVCAAADFLAIDVVTANSDPASICAVGVVHFKAGQISDQLKFLINPEDRFDVVNISLHGIRPENVSNKPTLRKMYPVLAAALSTAVVVHHTHFDRIALGRVADKYGFSAPACAWLDSAFVVRQTWERFAKRGYGLDNLVAEFKIELIHRDPCENARIAGLILLKAMAESELGLRDWVTRFEQQVHRHTSVLCSYRSKRVAAQRASPWAVIRAPYSSGSVVKNSG